MQRTHKITHRTRSMPVTQSQEPESVAHDLPKPLLTTEAVEGIAHAATMFLQSFDRAIATYHDGDLIFAPTLDETSYLIQAQVENLREAQAILERIRPSFQREQGMVNGNTLYTLAKTVEIDKRAEGTLRGTENFTIDTLRGAPRYMLHARDDSFQAHSTAQMLQPLFDVQHDMSQDSSRDRVEGATGSMVLYLLGSDHVNRYILYVDALYAMLRNEQLESASVMPGYNGIVALWTMAVLYEASEQCAGGMDAPLAWKAPLFSSTFLETAQQHHDVLCRLLIAATQLHTSREGALTPGETYKRLGTVTL